MGNLHLVTGYAGHPHVSAADQASLFESAVRSGEFVTAAGKQFAASVISNNTLRISDGELVMQGRHVKMTSGSFVDLTIENGTQGYLRHDLVVVRFSRNAESGIEQCSLVVIKGVPSETDPADPEYVTGNINAGADLVSDMPLYRLPISGLTVAEPVPLFDVYESAFDYLMAKIDAATVADGLPSRTPADIGGTGDVVTSANIDLVIEQGIYYTEIDNMWCHTIVFTSFWAVMQIQFAWSGEVRSRIKWGGEWSAWNTLG